MKQIIQDIKSGDTLIEKIPIPQIKNGCVLIRTHNSLVSLGTEKMLVDFGKASYIQKAKQQPEKVKQVLNKIKTDGLIPTLETVFRKLGEPIKTFIDSYINVLAILFSILLVGGFLIIKAFV